MEFSVKDWVQKFGGKPVQKSLRRPKMELDNNNKLRLEL